VIGQTLQRNLLTAPRTTFGVDIFIKLRVTGIAFDVIHRMFLIFNIEQVVVRFQFAGWLKKLAMIIVSVMEKKISVKLAIKPHSPRHQILRVAES
jgi:hypothetical protein